MSMTKNCFYKNLSLERLNRCVQRATNKPGEVKSTQQESAPALPDKC